MTRKLIVSLILSVLLAASGSTIHAQSSTAASVVKQVCASNFNYSSLEVMRNDLLERAKREAVNELFGELITASTTVDNLVVTADQIRLQSMGLIRLRGSAVYTNGANLAEVCVTITAYATEQDRAQFRPLPLTKRICVTEPTLTVRQVREQAEAAARLQVLLDYDSRLSDYAEAQILPLLRQVEYLESGFVSSTETYCATITGAIMPIEVIGFLSLSGHVINLMGNMPPSLSTLSPPSVLQATSAPSPTATATSTALPSPTATPTVDPGEGTCVVQSASLNLRPGPGTNYNPPLTSLPAGALLRPLHRNANGNWIEVQVASTSRTGWVSAGAAYVTCDVDIMGLTIGVIPPAPTRAPTPTVTPTVTPTPIAVSPLG